MGLEWDLRGTGVVGAPLAGPHTLPAAFSPLGLGFHVHQISLMLTLSPQGSCEVPKSSSTLSCFVLFFQVIIAVTNTQ